MTRVDKVNMISFVITVKHDENHKSDQMQFFLDLQSKQ